jgi:hypothetical protein
MLVSKKAKKKKAKSAFKNKSNCLGVKGLNW